MKSKTKRILATTLCGILTVSSTVFLGSTAEVDEDLERAKELAKSIFIQVEDDQEQPYYYADYMKGLDGEEDYIIVGRHNASGYAVFERSEMELVEYSETGEHTYRKEQYKYDIDTNGDGEADHMHSDETNHKVICSCGHYYLQKHTFIEHSNYDNAYHESKCICGHYGKFAHWYKFGKCRFCERPEKE